MSKFKDIIIARNGRDFFINWQKSLEKEKDALQNSNFEIKGELGKGGRGIVFLAEQDGAEVAAKVFVYQDECIPQASALFLWDGFAPKVLRIFSERTLLLEVLPEHGNIRNKYSLETGALLLSKIQKASPAERGGALSAYEYLEHVKMLGANKVLSSSVIEIIFQENLFVRFVCFSCGSASCLKSYI